MRRFLTDHTIKGWVGIDSGGSTFEKYQVVGRPEAVLIDPSGLVRGIGPPQDLTAETIENLLAGRPIVFSSEASVPVKLQSLPDPVFQVMIRPAAPANVAGYSPGAVSGQKGRSVGYWGVDLKRLLSEAYGIPESRIEAPGWAQGMNYDVAVADPDLTSAGQTALLQEALQDAFELKVHKEARNTAVYVLQRIAGTAPALAPSTSRGSSRWGKDGDIEEIGVPLAALAAVTSRVLGKPVLDETGMRGRFDFELKWEPRNPKSLLDAVRKLGLDLVEGSRPLDYLVVDSAVQPQTW